MTIPPFEGNGLLPPYVGDPRQSNNHSPFGATTLEIATTLCGTPARRELFAGLLAYRAELNAAGLIDGFQWVDGSFTEQIEQIEGRDPRDIDVLTVFRRPPAVANDADWQAFFRANRRLFDGHRLKREYGCHVVHSLDLNSDVDQTIKVTVFFNTLFSHQRVTRHWKGMLRLELDPATDAAAAAHIAAQP